MKKQPVWIKRDILNASEVWDHFASQSILSRIIPKSRLSISLAFTPRKFDHASIPLKQSFHIHDPSAGGTLTSQQDSQIRLYGRNRVLTQVLNSPTLEQRASSLSSQGITFFELDNFKPHIVLDYNLPSTISNWQTLIPFTEPIILKSETIHIPNLNFRKDIRYRNLKEKSQ